MKEEFEGQTGYTRTSRKNTNTEAERESDCTTGLMAQNPIQWAVQGEANHQIWVETGIAIGIETNLAIGVSPGTKSRKGH